MGGSGGDRKPPSGAQDRGTGGDDCNLRIPAKLFGVVPAVARTVRVNDILDVELITGESVPTVSVVTRGATPEQVGSLVGLPDLPVLIRCLQDGVTYEATVTEVSGPQISAVVTRA